MTAVEPTGASGAPSFLPYDRQIMLPEQKLDALVARYKAVERELASPVTPDTYVKLSREFAELAPIVPSLEEITSTFQR